MFGNKEKKEEQERRQREQAAAATQREQERLAAAEAERELSVVKFLEDFHRQVGRSVADHGRAVLYKEIYLPVDAQMNEFGPASGLDLQSLNTLGSQGWNVECVIPRTYGGFESYKISKTTAYGVSGWGKDEHKVGLGGHIVGVYALLSFTISPETLEASKEIINDVAHASIPDALSSPITRDT